MDLFFDTAFITQVLRGGRKVVFTGDVSGGQSLMPPPKGEPNAGERGLMNQEAKCLFIRGGRIA
jgi:hypothetical protein